MRCSPPWPTDREADLRSCPRQACRRRADLPPRQRRPRRAIPSNTRWSRTRPTSRCSSRSASSCTPASLRCSKSALRAGETGPEVLAQHLTDAGLAARAHSLLAPRRRTGRRPLGKCGSDRSLEQGAGARRTLPNGSERLDEELALRLAIGGPLHRDQGLCGSGGRTDLQPGIGAVRAAGPFGRAVPGVAGLWNATSCEVSSNGPTISRSGWSR